MRSSSQVEAQAARVPGSQRPASKTRQVNQLFSFVRLRGIIEQLAERVRNQRIARQQASVPVKVKKTEFTIPEETDYESLLSAEYTDGGDEQ